MKPDFDAYGLAPRAQGARATCSLFAITALAEFEFSRATPGDHRRFSEEFLIWAANAGTGRDGDQAMFYEAVHGLCTLGICDDAALPYAANAPATPPSDAACSQAVRLAGRWRPVWIRRWDVTRPLGTAGINVIRRALAEHHPVACGLRWPKQMQGFAQMTVPPADEVFDGHSIVLTGYRDDEREPGGGVFSFRNSAGPNWGQSGYGALSYAYVESYANDALWLEYTARPPVPIARFEAEKLSVRTGERLTTRQDMRSFGGGGMWSGGAQLLCRTSESDSVELEFAAPKPGRYRLRLLATAAPDFGAIRVYVNGDPPGDPFDLYCGRVSPSGPIDLGEHDLAAGENLLRLTAERGNPASSGCHIGVDAIDLLPPK